MSSPSSTEAMNNGSYWHQDAARTAVAAPLLNRRDFLWQSGGGLGGMALASMLGAQGELGAAIPAITRPARAKRVVHLFMAGAASHLDLWDFKPELVKRHGQPSDFGEH